MPSTSKEASGGWTLATLYIHFSALMLDQKEAVRAALASAETAVNKAEYNSEKWRDSANEWRQAMDDREVKFLPRTEYQGAHQALIDRIGMLENRVTKNEGTGQGLKQGWGYLIAAVALVMTLLGIFAALKH
jgi:hypothetical protein